MTEQSDQIELTIYCNGPSGGSTGLGKRIDVKNLQAQENRRSYVGPECKFYPRMAGKVKGNPREGVLIEGRIFQAVEYNRGTGRTDVVIMDWYTWSQVLDYLMQLGWNEVRFLQEEHS